MGARKPCNGCGGEKPPGRGVKRCATCTGTAIVPSETRREIVRLYTEDLLPISEIAKRVFWAMGTVHRILCDEGVEMRRRGGAHPVHLLTQDAIDEAVDLYRQGLSYSQVGERLGLKPTAARLRVVKAGGARTCSEGTSISRRFKFEQRGEDALNPRQRVLLGALVKAMPDAVATADLAQVVGESTKTARQVLEQLEAFGLARRLRRRHNLIEWRRTDLAAKDVLRATLAPPVAAAPPTGDVWLPIGPFIEWLNGLIARERRLTMRAIKDVRDRTTGYAEEGEGAIAMRLGISERRLYRFRHQQAMIPLSAADACLIRSGEAINVEDLWPHLAITEDAA